MICTNISYKNKPLIWPLPDECCWKEGYFPLGGSISISYDSFFKEAIDLLAAQIAAEGLAVCMEPAGGTLQLLKSCCEEIDDEGYILDVSAKNIEVRAKTCKGIFYGLQSLAQLISNSLNKQISCVYIKDTPFKAVRGVHIYMPPRNNFNWFKRFVDFLARFKYNTIFLEVSAAMKYDSHPEINDAWVEFCNMIKKMPEGQEAGIQSAFGHFKDSVHSENGGGSFWEKGELSELIEYTKDRYIEIIPEMQSLSHSYWMLLSHKECAERDDDPYPDTYCPSNPRSYEIYFDCLQEVVELFKPKTVSIGHDEYYSIGLCDRCENRTGHDILAGDLLKIHGWLSEKGIKMILWGDKLFEYTSLNGKKENGGIERFNFNWRTRKNELMKATYRAVDMIPNDITVLDWAHSLPGEEGELEDTGSQDYFYRRRINVVFGNIYAPFSYWEFKNAEERLRRSNVTGGECSLWREVSDDGLAPGDQLVHYLDIANILWFRGYRFKMRDELNKAIAQLYPRERDRMSGTRSYAHDNVGFKHIDISGYFNIPIYSFDDYRAVLNAEKLPNSIPFRTCKDIIKDKEEAACILVGHGMNERVDNIQITGKFRALAFLHSYSVKNPIRRHGWDINLEESIVGYYIVEYADGTEERIPVQYGITITDIKNMFGAYRANPIYQVLTMTEEIKPSITSKVISLNASSFVLFGYEWNNPHPEREIRSFSIEHDSSKIGGIILYAVTGIK